MVGIQVWYTEFGRATAGRLTSYRYARFFAAFSVTLGRIMSILSLARRLGAVAIFAATVPSSLRAQASVNETRDPNQAQDPEFVAFYKMWTHHGSPLVDHLPLVSGIPTPKQCSATTSARRRS